MEEAQENKKENLLMKIKEYKQMMNYLTRPKDKDPIKESLKKSTFVKELKEKDIPKEKQKKT